ncbi:hypothetical protein [Halalkalibacter krulwichiae]|uniref:Uncharacterized protein n=1 Tax=Halalkalibacter krulwichiae TaxID=199441 RepID=A0A1X9M8E2_9BACI|nr:hypothetical protein [Halalkalibacter krulwichiae]ARK29666.1 hypothetical protein BkAM31D_07225 [Halalkalibacter krulwichiae]
MLTNYEFFVPVRVRHKQKEFDVEQLFNNPLIHRQIKGDKVYIPLDTKRLWGY